MTERLIIRHFAGLENLDVTLGRVTIFIGPQASGKSVCAKCLYWFKSFLPEMLEAARAGDDKRTFDNHFVSTLKEYFPGLLRMSKGLFLRYELNDYFIQLNNIQGKLKLTYSELFREAAKVNRQEALAASGAGYRSNSYLWESSRLVAANDTLINEVDNAMNVVQSFILAGRSFFSALKGATLTFLAQSPVTDPFLRQFLALYELARRHYLNNDLSRHKELDKLIQHIVKGRIKVEGNEDIIISPDGRRSTLAYASSGQQEAFALLLILLDSVFEKEHESTHDGSRDPHTLYVEEPEAHLFSESQRAMAQLMASVLNMRPESLQLVITTHSPYLLASFNNLIYAHQLAATLHDQPAELKKLYQVVPKGQQLPLSDFQVYGFENGSARSLIDAESGLLSADLLDSASDVTANQFGELMALDPAIKP
ncbi:AAA family ATPase [Hymenobacter arcticus]